MVYGLSSFKRKKVQTDLQIGENLGLGGKFRRWGGGEGGGEGGRFPWHLSPNFYSFLFFLFLSVLYYLNSGLALLSFTFKRIEVIITIWKGWNISILIELWTRGAEGGGEGGERGWIMKYR